MTKKDYIVIAKVFNDYQKTSLVNYYYLANALAKELAKGNERFDYERFITACGVKENDNELVKER